jgi:hypothetical protein
MHAEITLDTLIHMPEENARTILDYLIGRGFIRGEVPQNGDASIIGPSQEGMGIPNPPHRSVACQASA